MDDDYRTRAIEAAYRAMGYTRDFYRARAINTPGWRQAVAAVDAVLALPRPYPPEVIEAAGEIRRNYGEGDPWLDTLTDFILGPPSPPLPEITDEQVNAFLRKQGRETKMCLESWRNFARTQLIAAREVLSDGE